MMRNVVLAGIASALIVASGAAGATDCTAVAEMTKEQAVTSCRSSGYPVCVVIRVEQKTWVAAPGATGSTAKALCLGANSVPNSQINIGLLDACRPRSALVPGAHLAGGGATCEEVMPNASPALGQQ